MKRMLVTATLVFAACAQPNGELTISNPEVRPLLPGRDVTAGHMSITGGAGDDVLLSASSVATDVIELHISTREDGISRMERLDHIDIPAGETVTLEQGGLHLMLFGLEQSELEGGLPITLTFDQAGDVSVVLDVAEPTSN